MRLFLVVVFITFTRAAVVARGLFLLVVSREHGEVLEELHVLMRDHRGSAR